ncbi:hypothetical protein MTR_8g074910 [Medicago truncatula]|uniref:Uncharacterized protein n=1 Tax=Medicago truncatula TaxID=3880 RepID=G7LB42_MEDTR|nr:hypothetical protein MTR_8g074910 [Medicago truncatula]
MVCKDKCHRFNDGLYHVVGSISALLTSTESPNLMIIPPPPNDMMLARIHRGFDYDVSTDTYRECATHRCWRKTFACPDFPILLKDAFVGPFVNGSINLLAHHSLNFHMNEFQNVIVDHLVILSLDMKMKTYKYMLPNGFVEMPQNGPNLDVLRSRMLVGEDAPNNVYPNLCVALPTDTSRSLQHQNPLRSLPPPGNEITVTVTTSTAMVDNSSYDVGETDDSYMAAATTSR